MPRVVKSLPDSPIKLAIWLVVVILLTDAAGLSMQIAAIVAIVFSGFCGWLIVRKRRGQPTSNLSDEPVSKPFSWPKTPLYTYGLLGASAASIFAVLGLILTGFDVAFRLIEWNWEGFGLSSLTPLVPAVVVGVVSILLVMLHEALHLNDGEDL